MRPRRALAALAWTAGVLAVSRVPAALALAPCLGVLRGPLGLVLAVVGAGVAVAHTLEGRRRPAVPRPRWLFAFSFGVFASMGLHYASRLQASGDEPHYLLMAQSLWQEVDLDLRDNLARDDYLEYTPGPLAPHYAAPRADGRPFPAHSPGLPMLLAPVYALAGRKGCVLFLALCAAALGLEVRALVLTATRSERAVLAAWLAATGAPVLFYAFHIYTEVPSALALSLALRLLVSVPGTLAAAGAALAASALPWLHVKLIATSAVLGCAGLWRMRGRARLVFAVVAGLMAFAFVAYYEWVFGLPTPLAIYGGLPRDASGRPLPALAGLLFDRSFGLLPFAPIFLLALAGLPRLVRRGLTPGPLHAIVAAAVLLPILWWRMWWGGQCPPARFLVPLVPFLALGVAMRVDASTRGLVRWLPALSALGLVLGLYMAAAPEDRLLLNRRDQPTRVWNALSGEAPIGRYLPSLVSEAPDEARVALVWTAALALLLALDRLARRRDAFDKLFRGLGLPLALLLLAGLAIDGWARRQANTVAPVRASAMWVEEGRLALERVVSLSIRIDVDEPGLVAPALPVDVRDQLVPEA